MNVSSELLCSDAPSLHPLHIVFSLLFLRCALHISTSHRISFLDLYFSQLYDHHRCRVVHRLDRTATVVISRLTTIRRYDHHRLHHHNSNGSALRWEILVSHYYLVVLLEYPKSFAGHQICTNLTQWDYSNCSFYYLLTGSIFKTKIDCEYMWLWEASSDQLLMGGYYRFYHCAYNWFEFDVRTLNWAIVHTPQCTLIQLNKINTN
jgi:hypothetical protein